MGAELVPIWLQLLAVASPRSQELHKGKLARLDDLIVEVRISEILGAVASGSNGTDSNNCH